MTAAANSRLVTRIYWAVYGLAGIAAAIWTLSIRSESAGTGWAGYSQGRIWLALIPFAVGAVSLAGFIAASKDPVRTDAWYSNLVRGREIFLAMMAGLAIFISAAAWTGFGSLAVGGPGREYYTRLIPFMVWVVVSGVLFITHLILGNLERGERLPLTVAIVVFWLVGVAQIWVITSGTMAFRTREDYAYYDLLAEGFLKGQTALVLQPDPRLLALSDPYSIEIDRSIPYPYDVALFQGRYYLPWGPVPGLVAAVIKLLLRIEVEDQYLVMFFMAGALAFITATILELRKVYFPSSPWILTAAGILAAGLANPVPWLLGRPSAYEVSITGGQFFLMVGLYFSVTGLAGKQPHTLKLTWAGLCWALAGGTRINLIPVLGFLAVVAVWRIFKLEDSRMAAEVNTKTRKLKIDWRIVLKPVIAFSWPVGLGVAGFLLYNYARFGSILETGMKYQVNGLNWGVRETLASTAYILPNLTNYFLRLPAFIGDFPFIVSQKPAAMTYPFFMSLVKGYHWEEIAGIIPAAPYAWLAAAALVGLGWGDRKHKWIVGWLTGAWLLELAPLAVMVGCTMRYQYDMWPTVSLLAVVGSWQLYSRVENTRPGRDAAVVVVIILAGVSALIGVLLGITSYYQNFSNGNPELFSALSAFFSTWK